MRSVRSILILLFFAATLGGFAHIAEADTATSSIQAQIDQSNAQIQQLKDDIAQLQTQLNSTTAQKQTLQSAINGLNLNIQKLQKSISLTQAQIGQQDLQIGTLATNISTTTDSIGASQGEVADSLRQLDELDNQPLIVTLLSGGTLSSFFDEAETLESLRTNLESHINDLASLRTNLQTSKSAAQSKRDQLAALNTQLGQQKQGLVVAQAAQTALLKQTKNQESTYQQLIATKEAQETAFENTLAQLQSQLKPVGSGTVPAAGAGVLQWPFSASVMATCPAKAKVLKNSDCITQYFGNTDFSTANPQVYNNMGHDGLDIGVPIGTPVLAALDGTVLATGNTDIKAPNGQMCYSFGKWVMLQHPNGLDTLYAHLSDNTVVSKGQTVTTGQLIGYSGMTGYATGPHLHLGVYVGAGVQIMDLGQWRGSGGTPCTDAGAILPVAPTNAYLNPLSYLPAL